MENPGGGPASRRSEHPLPLPNPTPRMVIDLTEDDEDEEFYEAPEYGDMRPAHRPFSQAPAQAPAVHGLREPFAGRPLDQANRVHKAEADQIPELRNFPAYPTNQANLNPVANPFYPAMASMPIAAPDLRLPDQNQAAQAAATFNQGQEPIDLDNDEEFARAIQASVDLMSRGDDQIPQFDQGTSSVLEVDLLADCLTTIDCIFPGICHEYVADLYAKISKSSIGLADHISSQKHYPRSKDTQSVRKRKRVVDEDEEAARLYGSEDRIVLPAVHSLTRMILGAEFPYAALPHIDELLAKNKYRLFSSYQTLAEQIRTYSAHNQTYRKNQSARRPIAYLKAPSLDEYLMRHNNTDPDSKALIKEYLAVKKIAQKADDARKSLLEAERVEKDNYAHAMANSLMGECGCCYGDYPLNRMVYCNSDQSHAFCKDCCRRNAEEEIGKNRWELSCMSVDGCTAGFDLSQRSQFLDDKTQIALDRNEQEASLRAAGIENLASCPFCSYAAEYPPVEINREFHCQAPECEIVSCRLCKEVSHIPQTCEEYKKQKGLGLRRLVEEAMSEALIRRCNKCNAPFIKAEGCNKMTCTAPGCRNIQCYVCSKSCDYSHFNDKTRGGKEGNCPLFENQEVRHAEEVSKAEKEALAKVLAENPYLNKDDMAIKMSEEVKADEERRKKAPGHFPGRMAPRPPAPGPPPVPMVRRRLQFDYPPRPAPRNPQPHAPPNIHDPGLPAYHHHDEDFGDLFGDLVDFDFDFY